MNLKERIRSLLTQGLGQQPSERVMGICTDLYVTEIHRVFGTVLSSARLSELRGQLDEGDVESLRLLTTEFPWSGQVLDAAVETVVRRAVENRGNEFESDWQSWPTPSTTLDEGRALVREVTASRGGLQALEAWPRLPQPEPDALRLITDRLEAEVGVRLALLADRAGTAEVCLAAAHDVVTSVVDDSGGSEGLGLWGSQLMGVNAAAVDGGTAMRVRMWSSLRVAEPVRSPDIGRIKINDDLLNRCGLVTLIPDERGPLLRSLYTELEMRVGSAVADGLNDAELEEFEHIFEAKDHDAASAWLAAHRPHYPQLAADHAAALEAELRDAAPTLLAALGTVLGADA